MADRYFTTWKPRLHIVKGVFQWSNCVRAYRSSPETVELQIRMDGRFVSTALTFAQARELGRHLIAETWPDEEVT